MADYATLIRPTLAARAAVFLISKELEHDILTFARSLSFGSNFRILWG